MDPYSARKIMMIAGGILLVAGFLWPWISKLGLGRLPGDIAIERENFRIYVPIATMLLLSALASLVLWLFRR